MVQTATSSNLPATSDLMLKVSGLNVYYGESHILRNVDLSVPKGEMVCLIGRNGVGKTTMLKTLMGLLKSRSGNIIFNGEPILTRSTDQRAKLGIGYVPQGREIFARLTVEENLLMGLAGKPAGTPLPPEIFEWFPVLHDMRHRRGGDLSGGQQQQLAIARALAAGPKVLVLDEPTEGIQPSIIKDIGRVIRMLADKGSMAIVLVEQYYDFARDLADDYVVMERGSVLAQGRGANMEIDGVRELVAI
jgi:urea transport system ATP-binding protein